MYAELLRGRKGNILLKIYTDHFSIIDVYILSQPN